MAWICRKCESQNIPTDRACEVCGFPAPVTRSASGFGGFAGTASGAKSQEKPTKRFKPLWALLLIVGVCLVWRYNQNPQNSPQNAIPIATSRPVRTPLPASAARSAGIKPNHHEDTDSNEHDEHANHHRHFLSEGALITNHGLPLLLQTQTASGFSPTKRAEIITDRLNDAFHKHGLQPANIIFSRVNGLPTVALARVKAKPLVLATIDAATARQFGFEQSPDRLALWWRDVLRDHAAIIAGQAPIFTTPYSSQLQTLYRLSQIQKQGAPSHESFERTVAGLSRQQRDELQSLYITIPVQYQPVVN